MPLTVMMNATMGADEGWRGVKCTLVCYATCRDCLSAGRYDGRGGGARGRGARVRTGGRSQSARLVVVRSSGPVEGRALRLLRAVRAHL